MRAFGWIFLAVTVSAASCRGTSPSVDADGDGVVAALDCDDSNPAVHTALTVYADADGDGVGAGPPIQLCTDGTVPRGYALAGTDCAPGDGTRWRAVVNPPADRDGDGFTLREQTTLCVGATLPEPYREVANGNDCDDARPDLFRWVVLYRDQDGDGIGASPRSILCVGAALPAGYSVVGYDSNDLDPSVTSGPSAADDLALVLE
jgi:hypothetical protein